MKSYALPAGIALLILSSCSSTPVDRVAERAARVQAFQTLQPKLSVDLKKTYTLKDCIDLACSNSLDLQIKSTLEKIAKEKREASWFGMLPSLNLSASANQRSNDSGGSSFGIVDGQESLRPSSSSERTTYHASAEIALSALDFGLAYLRTEGAHTQEELAQVSTDQAVADLRMQVIQSYFAACAAQKFIASTEVRLKSCEEALSRLEKLNANQADPEETLRLRRDFLSSRLRSREFERSYKNHCLNLTSLMGVIPTEAIQIDVASMAGEIKFPQQSVAELTDIALRQRTELRANDLQRHLAKLAENEKFLMMFPNVKLFAAWNADSNKYLYNQQWGEVGAQAMIDVMRLPALKHELKAAEMESLGLAYRDAALSMAVIAQVHIAANNLVEVRERLGYLDKICELSRQERELVSQRLAKGQSTEIQLAEKELQLSVAELDQLNALGNCHIAYYRLMNTSGISSLMMPDGSTATYDREACLKLLGTRPGIVALLKEELEKK